MVSTLPFSSTSSEADPVGHRVLFVVTSYFAIVDVMNHRGSGESAQKTHNAHLGV